MSDVNTVIVSGTVTQKPELRFTTTGIKITNLRIAINRRYKTKTGELKQETNFITVVVWNEAAESCTKYLDVRSRVLVEGRLQNREFVDKEQQKRLVTEIRADRVEFLDRKSKEEGTIGKRRELMITVDGALKDLENRKRNNRFGCKSNS